MNEPQPDPAPHGFAHHLAQRLVALAQLKAGEQVLALTDSAALTSVYATSKVAPTGQVITLDRQAYSGAPVDWPQAHPSALPFAPASFDCILYTTPLFLLVDLPTALPTWRRVLKPGGRVVFSGYGKRTGQPLTGLLETHLRRYGLPLPPHPFAWQQFTDLESVSDLLRTAAFTALDVRSEQLGCYLADGNEWWELLWHSPLRRLFGQLPLDEVQRFKTELLAAVAELATPQGIWLNVVVVFATGQKRLT